MKLLTLKKGAGATLQIGVAAVALLLLLASCGKPTNPSDVFPGTPPAAAVAVSGPDSFLLYPNPLSSPSVDSDAYATAYYESIDPLNQRTTLSAWKSVNGFDNPNPASVVEAVFGDMRDLGYGRYVHAVDNGNGNYAFYVDNYLVWSAAGYGYSSLNLDAAVAQDRRWYIGTNAIEFSQGPNGSGDPFPKYYTFDTSGNRLNAANLDGRGTKFMPGICTTCHGGRGDPLTPANGSSTGKQLFAILGNPANTVRGDLEGKLHFFEPDTFSFSSLSGFTRADQEAKIKTLNQWVLCTYPMAFATSGVAKTNNEDICRNPAALEEWQGSMAVDVLKAAYGGPGMPNSNYSDNYVPAEWIADGQSDLYMNVVQPTCRMCHMLRGNGQDTDNDFANYAAFQASADRIKAHIIDRGNMPLTKVLYNRFWSTPSMYNTLITFLQSQPDPQNPGHNFIVTDSSGAPLKPGRPIADPGPNRVVSTNSTIISASMSLFADTYAWSIFSDSSGTASLSNTSGIQTTLNTTGPGTYVVQLVASKGSVLSTPAKLTIIVPSSWPTSISPTGIATPITNPVPSAIRFSDIKAVLQRQAAPGSKSCINCHTPHPTDGSSPPPIMYADIDRNQDGLIASGVGQTDDIWFYTEVLGRINFSDIAASPLLRHPSGYHHYGGILPGFGNPVTGNPQSGVHADELIPGNVERSFYDMFLNWILNGAPYQ